MSVGLDEFMGGGGDSDEDKQEESDGSRDDNVSVGQSSLDPSRGDRCDKDKEWKYCPSCMAVSHKTEGSSWSCPDGECGVIEFKMGYNEFHMKSDFLNNKVEV